MKIKLKEVTVAELFDGYKDNDENGVVGYGGKLNIRPAYQREFVYDEKKKKAVIDTVWKGFPLNTMYWVKTGSDTYEVLDGQQRTLSICRFLAPGGFSVKINGESLYAHNIKKRDPEGYQRILDYKLMVYECEGTNAEKLEWFKVINIAGEPLKAQELRNAIYTGPWLSDAKRHFSKKGCAAYNLGKDYVSGAVDRQEFLEKAIQWIAYRDGVTIDDYMAIHQNDPDAQELWLYYQDVIRWVSSRFINTRKEMKSVDWGLLYRDYHDVQINPNDIEKRIAELMIDDDVTKKAGIYPYILTGEEKHLSIRAFSEKQKREAYEKQGGICPFCEHDGVTGKVWMLEEMEADHITPWHDGGKTITANCQMLCKAHNRTKSGK